MRVQVRTTDCSLILFHAHAMPVFISASSRCTSSSSFCSSLAFKVLSQAFVGWVESSGPTRDSKVGSEDSTHPTAFSRTAPVRRQTARPRTRRCPGQLPLESYPRPQNLPCQEELRSQAGP